MATSITQKPGEEILATLRKNPNKFSSSIAKFVLLVVAALILFVYFQNQYILLAAIAMLLVAFSYGLYYFVLWFYDVYIITNKRIVIVSQKSLFSREFIETDIDKIHDVTYSIRGIFATIFKYGTVTVRTNTGLNLEMTDLSDPDEVQEMIKNLADVTSKKRKKEISAEDLINFIQASKK